MIIYSMLDKSKLIIINEEMYELSRHTIIIIAVTILMWICILVVPLSSSHFTTIIIGE